MDTAENTRAEIVAKLGFFPPFFEPALQTPAILKELWRQTLTSYLENPLPMVFKEKLAALLGRYCSVPYCLICHSASLRPMGMTATQVLELLETVPLEPAEFSAFAGGLGQAPLEQWPQPGSEAEKSILECSVTIFLKEDAFQCHQGLRRALRQSDYDYLILFIAYNRVCLTWAEAHPELSHEADARSIKNLGPMLQDEPTLAEFFANYRQRAQAQSARRARWLTKENKRLIAEEQRLRMSAELSNADLHRERDMRDRFVAAMTHDLRSPLTAIKMRAELCLKKSADVESLRASILKIVVQVNRADDMIRDLLDACRLQFGQSLPIDVSDCDLKEIVAGTIHDLADLHGERVVMHVAADTVPGRWDGRALRRAIENLITNAVKYGDTHHPIEVLIVPRGEMVALSVHNAGTPLSEADKKLIFQTFQRTEAAKRSTQKGWGLGLPLVRGVAEAHGGTAEVVSRKGEGTTFTITVPRISPAPH